jgi:hypothetical protein
VSIRSLALQWYKSIHGTRSGRSYTSKFYHPAESWVKRSVWWFEIPMPVINGADTHISLLCETSTGQTDFYWLDVPTEYILRKLPALSVRKNNRLSLFLSAEENNKFVDLRGDKVPFGQFLKTVSTK